MSSSSFFKLVVAVWLGPMSMRIMSMRKPTFWKWNLGNFVGYFRESKLRGTKLRALMVMMMVVVMMMMMMMTMTMTMMMMMKMLRMVRRMMKTEQAIKIWPPEKKLKFYNKFSDFRSHYSVQSSTARQYLLWMVSKHSTDGRKGKVYWTRNSYPFERWRDSFFFTKTILIYSVGGLKYKAGI